MIYDSGSSESDSSTCNTTGDTTPSSASGKTESDSSSDNLKLLGDSKISFPISEKSLHAARSGGRAWSSVSGTSSTRTKGHHRSSAIADYQLLLGSTKPVGWGPIHPRPRQHKLILCVKIALLYAPLACIFVFVYQLLHPRAQPIMGIIAKSLQTSINQAVFLTKPYHCPFPQSARAPLSDNLDPLEFTHYEHIQTKLPAFQVELAHSLLACNHLRIRITRVDREACSRASEKIIRSSAFADEDESTIQHIAEELGPDTFQVKIEGAERLVIERPRWYDETRCEWEYELRLNNAGTAWLEVTHSFEDFNAFVRPDNSSTPIPRLESSLLPFPVTLQACAARCLSYSPPLIAAHSSLYPSPETAPQPLPMCSTTKPISGSYIPTPLPSLLYPHSLPPNSDTRVTAGLYTFVPSGCRFDHAGLRFREHAPCLERRRRILFIGDSHARSAYEGVRERLLGQDAIPTSIDEGKVGDEAIIGNVALEYRWGTFLRNGSSCSSSSHKRHTYDAVIVSSGTIHASDLCLSTSDFLGSLNLSLSQCHDSIKSKNTRFIYLTPPAFASSPEHGLDEGRDCRTGPRLELWASRAKVIAARKGWTVINLHALSAPVSADTSLTDGMHYSQTDAIVPLVDEVIHKIGICDYD